VYDTYGNTTQVIDPNGNVTFDNRAGCSVPVYPGYVIKAYGTSLAEQTNFWWDCASGLLKETQDTNGVITQLAYDAIGRPTLVQAALGAADESDTAYIYAEPLTAAAPIVVTECRDLTGNACLSWLNSGGGSASGGIITTKKFDQRGQLISSTSGDTTVVSLNRIAVPGDSASYDAVSNPFITPADASMGWSRRKYDQEGRLVATDYFGGDTCSGGGPCPYPWGGDNSNIGEVTEVYGGTATAPFNGTQWTVTDEVGNLRTLQNDGLGRLAFVQEGSFGYTTSYGYDVDRLASVAQGLQTRGFKYDAAGRLLTATNPETGTVTYTYDNNGNLKTRKDAVGRVATYLYDALDRVTEKEYADGPASSYAKTYWALYCYDAPLTPTGACPAAGTKTAPFIGRLAQVYAGGIAQDYWNYDHFGRPTYTLEYVNGTSYAFPSYAYNKQGGVSSITYPSGRVVNYTFDGSGRTATVQGTKGTTTTAYAGGPGTNGAIGYWGNGAIRQVNLAGGALSQSFTYNHRFWPASVTAAAGASSLLNLGYAFYGNGNVHTATIGNPGLGATLTQTFNYDSVNRLTGASESGGANEWAQNFGYDQFGNRSLLSSSTFNPYTGLTPQSAVAGTGPFTGSNQWTGAGYDGAGNQTSVLGTGSDSALYDTENRLATVIEPNVSVIQYSYDGDGKRVMKVVCAAGTSACTPGAPGAVATVYVYDAQGEMVEEAGPSTDAGTKYLFADGLGSTRLETNAAGGSVRCIDYAPFGLELPAGMGGRGSCYATASYPSGTPDILDAKFTGKERDTETGLDYFGARYFSGAQGRFTSPDPISGTVLHILNPQRWNMYAYAVNNPLAYLDPDGRDAIAVKFGNGAHNLGHAGIASVHHDGKGTFADFSPQHAGSPHDAGKYTFDDFKTQIQYGPDGKPTKASLTALANELADNEQQPRDSVSVAYFKTSDAETAALDAYINAARTQQAQGKQPTYWVGFRDCIGFCMNGMQKAGVGRGASPLTVPNLQYLSFWLWADQTATGSNPPKKEQVTSKICYTDENGKQVCQ
jgi:RHS repeat-associated protein